MLQLVPPMWNGILGTPDVSAVRDMLRRSKRSEASDKSDVSKIGKADQLFQVMLSGIYRGEDADAPHPDLSALPFPDARNKPHWAQARCSLGGNCEGENRTDHEQCNHERRPFSIQLLPTNQIIEWLCEHAAERLGED